MIVERMAAGQWGQLISWESHVEAERCCMMVGRTVVGQPGDVAWRRFLLLVGWLG